MARANQKSNHPAADVPTHLVVRALRPGFRRAGRAWPSEAATVALADLDAGQVAALLEEPLLETELVAA